ncbi:MAG: PEP-CTERM system histidine kinase PrsK [Chromatiales bacterium]|jgi:putative PEP-CTERM system histidine kinase
MLNIPALGFLLSAAFFIVLFILLLINWQKKLQGGFLIAACGASAIWALMIAYQLVYQDLSMQSIWVVETCRTLSWLLFLSYVLWELFTVNQLSRFWLTFLSVVYTAIALLLLTPYEVWIYDSNLTFLTNYLKDSRIIGYLALSVIGISLIEQLFRNTSTESRWTIKYLCLGLGLGFAYDFYLYADALLFQRIDPLLWQSRGSLNSLIAPLVAVSAKRNTDWSLTVYVSKKVVFHTTGIVGAGVYLLAMAFLGYYIKEHGGEYGDFFRVIFLAAAVLLLFILVSSGQLRAKLKVFLNKNFFKYQYDYRDEWLKLIHVLSEANSSVSLSQRVLNVMADLVDSHSGCLWLCDSRQGVCRQEATLNFTEIKNADEYSLDSLQHYLANSHWVIDLDEYRYNRSIYGDLELTDSLLSISDLWLIVPLFHDDRLHSMVWLTHSISLQKLNWENRDLLKMAGLQAASYMVLEQSARELSEARQFEGFNRLSAFVIHDLKNLIAQLSLVASNATRHKHNPEFIDDAIATIENSVGKMNRLMLQLKSAGSTEKSKRVDIEDIVTEVVQEKRHNLPVPTLDSQLEGEVCINAEHDRLSAVIGHVVQNAQDATANDGKVNIRITVTGRYVFLQVSDTGTGMDEDFIKNRLFKPFDTTKGLTGMGIGAYECKEFIESMGGEVEVDSTPGSGTVFTLKIPMDLTE